MYSYTSSDIFVKDTDAFFDDFRKDFGFLYLHKGGFLHRLLSKNDEVRGIRKDELPVIENLISKHFSNNIIFSDHKRLSAFSRLIFNIFSYISNYYCIKPNSRRNSYIHLAVFFLMIANYFQYEYMMIKARNNPKEKLYRDKYGNIINWHFDSDPDWPNEDKLEKLSYSNTYEIIANDALERVLHWLHQLPEDQETKELVSILIPELPPQLKSILESSSFTSS
jgi:hypothetical protein